MALFTSRAEEREKTARAAALTTAINHINSFPSTPEGIRRWVNYVRSGQAYRALYDKGHQNTYSGEWFFSSSMDVLERCLTRVLGTISQSQNNNFWFNRERMASTINYLERVDRTVKNNRSWISKKFKSATIEKNPEFINALKVTVPAKLKDCLVHQNLRIIQEVVNYLTGIINDIAAEGNERGFEAARRRFNGYYRQNQYAVGIHYYIERINEMIIYGSADEDNGGYRYQGLSDALAQFFSDVDDVLNGKVKDERRMREINANKRKVMIKAAENDAHELFVALRNLGSYIANHYRDGQQEEEEE